MSDAATVSLDGSGDIFFILGMPRSGTKLLRSLLNQNSQISVPELETDFFPYLVILMNRIGDCSKRENFEILYKDLLNQPFFIYLSDQGTLPDQSSWYDACSGFLPAQVFEAILRTVTGTVGETRVLVGDKSPAYINQVSVLHEHFPKARFIHICRDVRDYCLSINGAWGKNMIRAACSWARSLELLQPSISKINDQIIEVRYEDLLSGTELELRRICSFLGVEYQTQMMKLENPSENLGDTRGKAVVVSDNVEKYKKLLSYKQQIAIEKMACNMLRNYGYQTSWTGPQSSIGVLTEKLYQIMDGVSLVRSLSKERGLAGAIHFHWNHYRATRAR